MIHYPDRSVVIMRVQQVMAGDEQRDQVAGRLRLSASGPFLGQYQYGDQLEATVALRPPRGFLNPGLFDYGKYLRRQGITARASVSDPNAVIKRGEQPSFLLRDAYTWREKIRQAALASLEEEPLAIFLAMIIGETGYFTQAIRDHFMASGTTHILSISGSHLELVALVVFPLLRLATLSLPPHWLLRLSLYLTASQVAALLTVFPVAFYALLAGGQVATVRSLIMILVYLVSVLVHREHNLINALALAAILVLVWNPQAVGEISFQLSYGSVLMMALAIGWFHQRKLQASAESDSLDAPIRSGKNLLEKGWLYGVITLAAMLGTAPIVAFYFNQVSWVGILSNLLVVPIAGVVIVPLGLFSAMGSLLFETSQLPLAGLLQGLYTLFYSAVRFFSEIPGAEWRVASPTFSMLMIIYLVFLAVFLNYRKPQFCRRVLPVIILLGLVMMAKPLVAGSTNPLRITFLDVGQGDAAVVQFPNGRVMVVDGGKTFRDFDLGRLVVAPFLWDQGIHRIDYLVATHPQLDHIGGLVFLMERFSIGEVWTNGAELEKEFYKRFRDTLHKKGLSERRISRLEPSQAVGACRVDFLNPRPPSFSQDPSGIRTTSRFENNRSIVLKITCSPYSYYGER